MKQVQELLDVVRAIAAEGLHYAENPHDQARYERLLSAVAHVYAFDGTISDGEIRNLLRRELGSITPKLGVDLAVPSAAGTRILALRRADDSLWCLPGGWVDVGETIAEAAIRECLEEAGLRVTLDTMLGVSEKGPGERGVFTHQVNVLLLSRPVSAPALVQLSHEHTEYTWVDTVNTLAWHPGHERAASLSLSAIEDPALPRLSLPG